MNRTTPKTNALILLAFFIGANALPPGRAKAQDHAKLNAIRFTGRCDFADGSPAAGANVHLFRRQYGHTNRVARAKASDDGTFAVQWTPSAHQIIAGTAASTFSLMVFADGHAAQFVAANTKESIIQLHPASTISGTVVDADGKPVPNAIVHAGRNLVMGIQDAVTDADGKFVIDDVRANDSFKPNEPSANRVFASHPQLGYSVAKLDRIPSQVQIAFDQPLPDSYGTQYRRAGVGIHEFPGGITVAVTRRVYHGADVMTEGLIRWPANDTTPAMSHKFQIASDAFGNREEWTLFWPKDRCQIWIASAMRGNPYTRVIDFSDPTSIARFGMIRKVNEKKTKPAHRVAKVLEARLANVVGEESKDGLPHEAVALLNRVFPTIPKDDKRHLLSAHEDVAEAKIATDFVVHGLVTNANGDPLSGIGLTAAFRGSSAGEITRTGTKQDGTYTLKFSIPVSALSTNSNLVVAPNLANHFESSLGDVGRFSATLVPIDSPVALLAGKPARANFQLRPAATLVGQLPELAAGKLVASWQSTGGLEQKVEHTIDRRGGFRITNLPAIKPHEVNIQIFNDKNELAHAGVVQLEPGEMQLRFETDKSVTATPVDQGPVQVFVIRNQKSMSGPDDQAKFSSQVQRWVESCQSNNTVAVADFNPNVWQDVVTGYNLVRLKFAEPRKMLVHTDDGQQSRAIKEIAFSMYDMKPGTPFLLTEKETLVLQDPLIEPTIDVMSHPALECFVTNWYQSYIDAWNHPPVGAGDRVANLSVNPEGKLTLNQKPLPSDIHKLGGILRTEGYDRRDSVAIVKADSSTPFSKLHWVMWYLSQHGWKGKVALRTDAK